MSKTVSLVAAVALAVIALPVAAQTQAPLPPASERTGNETLVKPVKKTPEQLAKEKAEKEKIRADAMKGPVPAAELTGNESLVKGGQKKTPEQLAKEKADKEKIRANAMKGPVPEAERTGMEPKK